MAARKTATKSRAKSSSRKSRSQGSNLVATPIHVDSAERVNMVGEATPMVGHFATVESGEHSGKYGVVDSVAEYDKKTGYPKTVVFVTRDENNERLVVPYRNLKASEAGRR